MTNPNTQFGAAPATGNTEKEQEMYAAGIRTGEENAKHNAAIRASSRDWTAIQAAIDEYLDGYELRADEGAHTPTGFERFLLDDCIAGLLAEDEILALLSAAPASPVSTVEQGEVVAWMDPNTLDVISSVRKASWLSDYGIGGKAKAATYTRALGDLRPARAAGDALDPNHRPDLHYILGVLDRLAKAAPKDQELAAALNCMRYVVSRTDAAIAAQRQGEA
ncbi:hypothetical protein [Achromobacter ruhlandii]|uniref:hypothetical protein n=1 Tax=Achromobacter ruhlandii TaxID=72557 RepID=UPI0006C3D2BD|nr:hypothetical protein [Achromobacter ruhlandii]AMG45491.1 hypothetical protein AL520_14345 [Achromobacter xylosoxidans]CUJ39055.1 Uncharacterised protein [Achromobacter ruhlandii]